MTAKASVSPYPTYWITVAAHKGGVGKTTIAAHVAAAMLEQLGQHGQIQPKVLLIDLDPQANLTDALGAVPPDSWWLTNFAPVVPNISEPCDFMLPVRPTFADLLRRGAQLTRDDIAGTIEPVGGLDGLFLLPSGWDLERASYELVASMAASGGDGLVALTRTVEFISRVFAQLDQVFDVVVVDCPPGLSPYVSAALAKADRVVMPALPDVYSYRALYETRASIHEAYVGGNAKIDVGAVVLTQLNKSGASEDIAGALQRTWGDKLFPEFIPQRTVFRDLALTVDRPHHRNPLLFEMSGKENKELAGVFGRLAAHLLQQHPRIVSARIQATQPDSRYGPRHILRNIPKRPVPPAVAPPSQQWFAPLASDLAPVTPIAAPLSESAT